jgi:hypothetical protein
MSPDHDVAIELSGLGWPVKQSFVRYVAALVDGRAGADDGAVTDGSWGFVFPVAAAGYDDVSGSGRLAFGGAARFRGHFGMLAIDLVHPVLELGEGSGTLSVGDDGLVIADVRFDFRADAAHARWLIHTVTLSDDGAALFGGVYATGDPLDPMVVALDRAGRR